MDHDLNHRFQVNAAWFIRLRWVATVGQLLTIGTVWAFFEIDLPVWPLLAIVGFTAATNLVFIVWIERTGSRNRRTVEYHAPFAVVAAMDLISLTALLYLTGGLANPFVVFYIVNLALSAVVLPTGWSLGLTGIAVAGIGFLHLEHRRLPELERLEQTGRLVAISLCAIVVVHFVTRVTAELRRRERELRIAEQQRARAERLEALATLAAGTGHELASPLSTVAVVAKELTRHLEGTDVPRSVLEDVELIRSELNHCRSILDRMSARAGEAVGEAPQPISCGELIEDVVEGLRHRDRVEIRIDAASASREITIPLQAVSQAVRGVVQNGLDASPDNATVSLTCAGDERGIVIEVSDRGDGMPPDVLERAGEPFFTTKEPGQGMGMGLFLTRNVVERLGGQLRLTSEADVGTVARIELPVMCAITG